MESTFTTLTASEIEAALAQTEADLKAASDKLEATRADLEAVDKSPISDKEREERRAKLTAAMDRHEEHACDLVDNARARLESLQAMTSFNEPKLSVEELAIASAQREFVREDVETRSAADLIALLRRAIVQEDRPSLFTLTRYLPKRLEGSESWEDSGDRDDVDDLRSLVTQARQMLRDNSLDALNSRAGELPLVAANLDDDARRRSRGNAKYSFQSGNEVEW